MCAVPEVWTAEGWEVQALSQRLAGRAAVIR